MYSIHKKYDLYHAHDIYYIHISRHMHRFSPMHIVNKNICFIYGNLFMCGKHAESVLCMCVFWWPCYRCWIKIKYMVCLTDLFLYISVFANLWVMMTITHEICLPCDVYKTIYINHVSQLVPQTYVCSRFNYDTVHTVQCSLYT